MTATLMQSNQPSSLSAHSITKRPLVRNIGMRERPWANKRMQHGLGQFCLEPCSGIYFDQFMPESDRQLLQSTLAAVPAPLILCARDLNLTMATCQGLTPNGNSSTCYADFRSYDKAGISPHIVMGSGSLTEFFVLPHVVHELCHLFYASLPLAQRQLWCKLLGNEAPAAVEITQYAARHKKEWRELDCDLNSYLVQNRFEQYACETFCETVAALLVPAYRQQGSTVDLWSRRNLLAQLGLLLDIKLVTSTPAS